MFQTSWQIGQFQQCLLSISSQAFLLYYRHWKAIWFLCAGNNLSALNTRKQNFWASQSSHEPFKIHWSCSCGPSIWYEIPFTLYDTRLDCNYTHNWNTMTGNFATMGSCQSITHHVFQDNAEQNEINVSREWVSKTALLYSQWVAFHNRDWMESKFQ